MLSREQFAAVQTFDQRFGQNPWSTRLHNILTQGQLGHSQWLEVAQIRLAAVSMVEQAASRDGIRRAAEELVEAADFVLAQILRALEH
jgi:hypothetical protein